MTQTLPDSIRHKFPIVSEYVYTNSCSQGALSEEVRAAYERYLTDWDEIGAAWGVWVDLANQARSRFARLLNAREDEIAVTTSTSAGVSSLMSGLGHPDGRNKIVMTDNEFPTIGQIMHAQELVGSKIEHVPSAPDTTVPVDRVSEAIDEQTALVAITLVCFRNGAVTDVQPIIDAAHEAGAMVLLDAFQGLGAMPVDVRELDVDFVAGGTLKYLLGSAGLGFLYCKSDILPKITPSQTGWFADRDIFEMDIHDYSPSETATKFESGTPPVPSIYAGVAGMDLMHEIGVVETQRHVRTLTDQLVEGLDRIGAPLVTPRDPTRRGPMIAVAVNDEAGMVAALQEDGILTSNRDGNIRLSWHCYNSSEDIERTIASLDRHSELFDR
jgi:selenocysteine lyase/cysteine desulfurase